MIPPRTRPFHRSIPDGVPEAFKQPQLWHPFRDYDVARKQRSS